MMLEPQHLFFLLGGVAIITFIVGRISRKGDLEEANRRTESRFKQYSEAREEYWDAISRIHELNQKIDELNK